MKIRGLYHVLRDRKEDGLVFTEEGLRRKRDREQAQLVREQRAEIARQRSARSAGAESGSS
jgi:DNA-binding PadR family transcriptional regulator